MPLQIITYLLVGLGAIFSISALNENASDFLHTNYEKLAQQAAIVSGVNQVSPEDEAKKRDAALQEVYQLAEAAFEAEASNLSPKLIAQAAPPERLPSLILPARPRATSTATTTPPARPVVQAPPPPPPQLPPAPNYLEEIKRLSNELLAFRRDQEHVNAGLRQIANNTNRINYLSNVTINSPTITGTIVDLKDSDVPDDLTISSSKNLSTTALLSVSGASGTSTFSANVNISGNLKVGTACINCGGSGGLDTGTTTLTNIAVSNLSTSTFAGGLAVQTSKLVVENTSGNVGVGTTTPAAAFAVQGNALVAGTTTVAGVNSTGTVQTVGLSVTGSATSSFTGGASFAGVSSSNGLAISGGSLIISSTASSTLANGVNITAGCFAINGACVGGAAASGWTDAGTIVYTTTSTDAVGVATTSVGAEFILGVHGNALFAGTTTVAGVRSTGTVQTVGLSVTGSATSSFTGGLTASSIGATGGISLSGGSFLNTSTATSTFSGGIVSAGLRSSGGISVSDGSLLISSTASSTFAGGINLTAGCFSINGVCVGGSSGSGTVNSGTAGFITYYPATGTTVDDTSNLYWDNANARLGISTTTPTSNLTIVASSGTTSINVASSSTHFIIDQFGRVGIGTGTPYAKFSINSRSLEAGDLFAVATSSASATSTGIRIDQNGRIVLNGTGIPQAPTASPLELVAPVNHSFSNDPGTVFGSLTLTPTGIDGTSNSITFRGNNNGSVATQGAAAGIYVQSSSAFGTKMYFGTTNSYASGAQTRMMIDHVGNVGIGTVSPNNKIHISGSGGASITASINNSFIRMKDTNTDASAKFGISWEKGDDTTSIAAIEPVVVTGWDTHLNFYNRVGGSLNAALHLDASGAVTVNSTGAFARLGVVGAGTGGANAFEVADSASSTIFKVADNGRVGIGTTSPDRSLSVHGNVLVSGTTSVSGLLATSSVQTPIVTVTGSATSSFTGGLTASALGITGGISLSGGSFTNTSAATSTWSGGLDLATLTVTGGAKFSGGSLLFSSTASSTFAGGINLTAGCFSINGVCVGGGGGGSGTVNSGTAGFITYYPSTGTTVDDASNLYWDNANSRLGISTTTPTSQLTIAAASGADGFNIASSSTYFVVNRFGKIGISTSTPFAKLSINSVSNDVGDLFAVATSSASATSTAVRIDQNGKIIINNTGLMQTPAASPVEIVAPLNHNLSGNPGTEFGSLTLSPTGADGTSASITFRGNNNGSLATQGAQAGIYVQSSSAYGSKMYFGTTNSYASGAQTRMMIDHVGNVGIGTVSPNNKIHISGSGGASITASINNSFIRMKDTNTDASAKFGISWERGDSTATIAAVEPVVITGWDTHINFYNQQGGSLTNALHLDANGSASFGSANPFAKLGVLGVANGTGANLFEVANSASTTMFKVTDDTKVGIGTTSPTTVGTSTGLAIYGSLHVHASTSVPELRLTNVLGDIGSSTPKANTLYRENIVKGWIIFSTNSTTRIGNAFNVSSLTDNATGDTTITWQIPFTTAHYAVAGLCSSSSANCIMIQGGPTVALTASAARVLSVNSSGTTQDAEWNSIIAIGDQ